MNDIWDDPPFCDLSGPAQHIYVWSFTNQKANMAGLYKVQRFEFGAGKWPDDVRDAAIDEIVRAGMFVYERPWLWVCARVKRLTAKSPYMARSVAKDIAAIDADHPLRAAWLERYGDFPWLKGELARALAQPQLEDAAAPEETVSGPSPVSALESENQGPSLDGPPRRRRGRSTEELPATTSSRLPDIDADGIRHVIKILNLATVNDGHRQASEAYGDDMRVLSALQVVPPPDGTAALDWALQAAHSVVARGKANVGRLDSFLRELKALKANHDSKQTRMRTFGVIDGGAEDANIERQLERTEQRIAEADL